MARTLDPAAHAVRRDAFVDAAQRLIQAKGYEEMSDPGRARRPRRVAGRLLPLLRFEGGAARSRGRADGRCRRPRALGLRWSKPGPDGDDASSRACSTASPHGSPSGRTSLHAVMEIWLADDNAIVREKFRRGVRTRMTPAARRDHRPGRRRGGDRPPARPATSPRVLVSLILGANEAATELYFAREAGTVTFDEVVRTLEAYPAPASGSSACPPGSFPVADRSILRQWFG